MSSLRERLAAGFAKPRTWCEHPGNESCEPWHRADIAEGVFVQWLRDIADTTWTPSDRPTLHLLADAIEGDDHA